MENLKISIITPSFNQGRFIEETILSIKNQSYKNVEHIIIDGGSTDDTIDIIKKYEKTYNMKWISEKDEGQADAINKGFKKSTGNILTWLNSDDTYNKNALAEVASKFNSNSNCMFIYGSANIIDDSNNMIKAAHEVEDYNRKLLEKRDYISQPSTFYRKELIDRIGLLDKNLYWTMDWDLWLRASKICNLDKVNFTFANMRVYEGIKTLTKIDKRSMEMNRVLKKNNVKRISRYYYFWISIIQGLFMKYPTIYNIAKKGIQPIKKIIIKE